VVLNTRLLNDVTKLSPLHQTSSIESFHSLILRFAPKTFCFSYLGILSRYLASCSDLLYYCQTELNYFWHCVWVYRSHFRQPLINLPPLINCCMTSRCREISEFLQIPRSGLPHMAQQPFLCDCLLCSLLSLLRPSKISP